MWWRWQKVADDENMAKNLMWWTQHRRKNSLNQKGSMSDHFPCCCCYWWQSKSGEKCEIRFEFSIPFLLLLMEAGTQREACKSEIISKSRVCTSLVVVAVFVVFNLQSMMMFFMLMVKRSMWYPFQVWVSTFLVVVVFILLVMMMFLLG